jgi:hypothetical protein
MGLAATSACGRSPLDDQEAVAGGGDGLAGSGGNAGAAGAGGFGGRVPAKHRATAQACPVLQRLTGPTGCPTAGMPNTLPGLCTYDSDCGAKPNGRCEAVFHAGQCGCVYDACGSDGDCGGGELCACNPIDIGNRCVPGSCRVDADCGAGGFCGPVFSPDSCARVILSYQCHTATDKCLVDGDCPLRDSCDAYPGEGWACRLPITCR